MEKGTTVGVDENTSQLPDEVELAQNYCTPGGTRTPTFGSGGQSSNGLG